MQDNAIDTNLLTHRVRGFIPLHMRFVVTLEAVKYIRQRSPTALSPSNALVTWSSHVMHGGFFRKLVAVIEP